MIVHEHDILLANPSGSVSPKLAFGDTDTYVYESADDVLDLFVAGSIHTRFNNTSLDHYLTLKADHIAEHTNSHGVVFDNAVYPAQLISFIGLGNCQVNATTGNSGTGFKLALKGGTGYVGNNDGGMLLLMGGDPTGSGVRGSVCFGTGSTGLLPAKSAETNVVYYDTATGKISYGTPSATVTLNDVGNPTADKAFTMTSRQLKFTWTNPTTADGAMELEATGNFSGDLLHIHQHTGVPSASAHLIHAESSHANVTPIYGTGTSLYIVHAVNTNASTSSAGVYGEDGAGYGVYGLSSSGVGGVFASTSGIGLSGISTSGNEAIYASSLGTARCIMASHQSSSSTSTHSIEIERAFIGSSNVTGDIIHITEASSTSGTISGSILKVVWASTTRLDLYPAVADGGTTVAYIFDTHNVLSTTGARLLSLRNHGTEKFYIDKGGVFGNSGCTFDASSGTNYSANSMTFQSGIVMQSDLVQFYTYNGTLLGAGGQSGHTTGYSLTIESGLAYASSNANGGALYLRGGLKDGSGITGKIYFNNDLYPETNDSYYLGKNSISTPLAWKGVVLKDTTNGNYYRITVVSGTITVTQIT